MDLVLKMPKGKPPFIGVLFLSQWDAQRTNKLLPDSYSMDTYQISLEPSHKLFLNLHNGTIHRARYELGYDPVKLLRFLHQTRECRKFNFGHVYLEDGDHKIALTTATMKKFVLKVDKVDVVAEDQL